MKKKKKKEEELRGKGVRKEKKRTSGSVITPSKQNSQQEN